MSSIEISSKFNLSSDSGLVVFTGNGCSSCGSLKRQLTEKSVNYTEYNVHENEAAASFLRNKGYRTLPMVFMNGQPAQLNG